MPAGRMELLVLGLLALIAVQAEEDVVVQEVKPSGEETVGGHNKKVNKQQCLCWF